jgi:predicted esterase
MKKPDEALEWLEKSLDKGFNEFAHMERDGDLDNVRKHPGYAKMVQRFSAPVLKSAVIPSFIPNQNPGAAKGLLVMLHGAGSDANRALQMWKSTAEREGLILLCPQGDQSMETGGFAHGSASESVIVDAVKRWTDEHKIPAENIFIGGFSQGAAVAFQVAIRHTELFAGLVSIGGFYGVDGNEEFLEGLDGKNLKLYLIHGLDDSQTLESARELRNLLVRDGVPAVLRRIEGGHEVNKSARSELDQAISWFLGRSDGRSQRRAF